MQTSNHRLGQPVAFASGPLAGLTVRVEMEEIQKADVGRKYARKDKRPLDPPPVVLCHFYHVLHPVSTPPREKELDVESLVLGAVCHVDLFPLPPGYEQHKYACPHASPSPPTPAPPSAPHSFDSPLGHAHADSYRSPHATTHAYAPSPPRPKQTGPSYPAIDSFSEHPLHPPTTHKFRHPVPGTQSHDPYGRCTATTDEPQASTDHDPDIVAWFGSFPIRESSKCTYMLAGVTFTQAEAVDHHGKRVAMFVFSDIAVRTEGTFILRYRALHVSSQKSLNMPFPVLTECYGGAFKIYSTKEFPGLAPSTPLTRLLSLHNVRVNMRENERKRRRKSDTQADSPNGASVHAPHRLAIGGQSAAPLPPTPSLPSAEPTQYSPTMSVSSSTSGPSARSGGLDTSWRRHSDAEGPIPRWDVPRGSVRDRD